MGQITDAWASCQRFYDSKLCFFLTACGEWRLQLDHPRQVYCLLRAAFDQEWGRRCVTLDTSAWQFKTRLWSCTLTTLCSALLFSPHQASTPLSLISTISASTTWRPLFAWISASTTRPVSLEGDSNIEIFSSPTAARQAIWSWNASWTYAKPPAALWQFTVKVTTPRWTEYLLSTITIAVKHVL